MNPMYHSITPKLCKLWSLEHCCQHTMLWVPRQTSPSIRMLSREILKHQFSMVGHLFLKLNNSYNYIQQNIFAFNYTFYVQLQPFLFTSTPYIYSTSLKYISIQYYLILYSTSQSDLTWSLVIASRNSL